MTRTFAWVLTYLEPRFFFSLAACRFLDGLARLHVAAGHMPCARAYATLEEKPVPFQDKNHCARENEWSMADERAYLLDVIH
jgi:hypothetical protein